MIGSILLEDTVEDKMATRHNSNMVEVDIVVVVVVVSWFFFSLMLFLFSECGTFIPHSLTAYVLLREADT